jgi:hypothetical protein
MNEWIKTSERLPERNTWVLCYFPRTSDGDKIYSLEFSFCKCIEEGKLREFPIFKTVDRTYRVDDVTHWMPLPKSPDQ